MPVVETLEKEIERFSLNGLVILRKGIEFFKMLCS